MKMPQHCNFPILYKCILSLPFQNFMKITFSESPESRESEFQNFELLINISANQTSEAHYCQFELITYKLWKSIFWTKIETGFEIDSELKLNWLINDCKHRNFQRMTSFINFGYFYIEDKKLKRPNKII